MKTILVVYTKSSCVTVDTVNNCHHQKYAFRINGAIDVQTGDILKSPAYNDNMIVVDVLDKDYQFYNQITGELKFEVTSTKDFPIKTLEFTEKDNLTEFASFVHQNERT